MNVNTGEIVSAEYVAALKRAAEAETMMRSAPPSPIQLAARPPIDEEHAYIPCACDGPCDCKLMTVAQARRLFEGVCGMNSVARGSK